MIFSYHYLTASLELYTVLVHHKSKPQHQQFPLLVAKYLDIFQAMLNQNIIWFHHLKN